MGNFHHGVAMCSAGNFALSFSLNFLSICTHITDPIRMITLIWVLLERSFPPAAVEYTCRWWQFWSKLMTSQVEGQGLSRAVTAMQHRSQKVKQCTLQLAGLGCVKPPYWLEYLTGFSSFCNSYLFIYSGLYKHTTSTNTYKWTVHVNILFAVRHHISSSVILLAHGTILIIQHSCVASNSFHSTMLWGCLEWKRVSLKKFSQLCWVMTVTSRQFISWILSIHFKLSTNLCF